METRVADSDAQHLTSPGAMLGTVAYVAGTGSREGAGCSTNLFFLGAVLYEMASGALPFQGESSAMICEAIVNRVPVKLVRLNQDVPTELERIIDKALEKDRNLRYQHASDMRSDLQRLKRDTDSGRFASPLASGSEESSASTGPNPFELNVPPFAAHNPPKFPFRSAAVGTPAWFVPKLEERVPSQSRRRRFDS